MTPELIEQARAWLISKDAPTKISDTIEEALELAMDSVLTELRREAEREEWEMLRSR